MAFYKINFTLNGERHFTSGMSSYPSAEMIEKGEEINSRIALDNAMIFIGGYMDAMHLTGRVNPNTVHYEIQKDMPKG